MSTIERLEAALVQFRSIETPEGVELVAAAGEALGVLKTYGNFNVVQIMYDMARLAGAGGYTPDDFADRARDANQ